MFASSRRVAGALSLAVVGVAAGGVIAQADDTAPRAHAAAGGVSMTPALVEHAAKKGTVGSVTVKNSTTDALKVTVVVRPWNQDPNTGGVAANLHSTMSHYVKATTASFTLAPGSRTVSFKLLRSTASGSLYGGIDVFAKQVHPKARNGIIPQYRVIGKMRLDPSVKRPNLRVGNVIVSGKGSARALYLPVRNLGNTLDPVGGTVTISGAGSRNGNVTAIAVVPSKVVRLKAGALSGLKAGNYTATFHLTQGAKKYTARRGFKL